MPIYIQDSSPLPAFFGRVSSTMGSFTTDFNGVNTPQPDIDGSLNRALDTFVVNFKGSDPYPKTATPRTGAPNWGQDGALAATDRIAIGLMDACSLTGFGTSFMDTTPPANNWISRTQVSQEIIDANPDGSNYLFYYENHMETGANGSLKAQYLDAQTGPNGSDGWCRDQNGVQFSWGFGIGTNNSNFVQADSNGQHYPEWHADNIIQVELIDPHIAAGVKIGGKGGVNAMFDNVQLHSNKSGCDWDQNGSKDNTETKYDPENAQHVADDPVAVIAYSGFRENSLKGVKRYESNNPGSIALINSNQHSEEHRGAVADLRSAILEYRLSGDTETYDFHSGFSEQNANNVASQSPRSGVGSNGLNRGQSGTWQAMYNNVYQSVRLAKEPKVVFLGIGTECLSGATNGPAGRAIWPNIPDPASAWNMARWGFATACIAGAYYAPAGVQIGTQRSGTVQSTPLFEFMGLINGSVDYGFGSGVTKLFRHWMGTRTAAIPTEALVSTIWVGYWENCVLVLNSDNNEANSDYSLDTSLLTGGPYKQYLGDTQNTSVHNGADIGATLVCPPIDAHILVDKTWYDGL